MSYKVLALEGLTKRGADILRAEGWTIDVEPKPLAPEVLIARIPEYHALLLRSGNQINADVINAATQLKVIGRPGVGVDNVDIPAATRRGIVVMNSPGGNAVSTAELAMALLLGLARNIAPADAAMKTEKWDRKSFAGIELAGKRLGVIGFGRIGRELSIRCRSFGMEVVAFDPFVAPAVAEALHIKLVSMDELLAGCDFISLHTTLNKDTKHLLGREAFAKIKPGVRIINAARGELIDDEALLEAIESGRVAGVGVDVYPKEPPKDWRLAKHPKVLSTPHLGASTAEAQERVGTDIAVQVRDFLKGGVIQQAVNFFSLSGDLYDQVRPAMELAERLGALLGHICDDTIKRIEVGLYGELREIDLKPILSAAVAGILRPVLAEEAVTVVNSLALAKERGIEVVESTSSAPVAFSNLMELRITMGNGALSAAGTIFGRDHVRLVDIDGVEMDAIPQGHLLFVRNDDTPGVVGKIGTVLGAKSINIARMSVGRKAGSPNALMLIEVDCEMSAALLKDVAAIAGVREARAIKL